MKSAFRPGVESLEGRDVPTVTFISLASSANPSVFRRPVTITATVTGGDFQPGSNPSVGDSVFFLLNDRRQPFMAPVVNGVATLTLTPPPGRNSISALYSGGVIFGPGGVMLVNQPSETGPMGFVQRVVRPHHHRP